MDNQTLAEKLNGVLGDTEVIVILEGSPHNPDLHPPRNLGKFKEAKVHSGMLVILTERSNIVLVFGGIIPMVGAKLTECGCSGGEVAHGNNIFFDERHIVDVVSRLS